MPKNDEGEFELVLGNRQLISVFLIIVVLLGVFFSMGYIVGRNSSPVETARTEKPSADTSAATSSSSDATTSSPPAIETPSSNTASETPPSITQPEKPAPTRAARAESKEVKKEKRSPAPASEAPAAPASVTNQVASGQYWQVVATARPDAEIIAEALGKKGFHAILSPAPKEGVFRVLVGPFAEAASQAQARTNLEAAGFKNPILRKY